MTRVVVYTKEGCHLCENVISVLTALSFKHPFELSTQDITASSELFERYKYKIPVVEVDGKIRLGGSALSNPNTVEDFLRKLIVP